MRLITKDQRNAAREYQFRELTLQGYNRETYGKREIFTKDEEPRNFYLKSWYGNAAHPDIFYVYRDKQQRDDRAVSLKQAADAREEFKRKHPPRKSGAAECATAIRKELKAKFPGIDFSVRSENFAGGDAVRVGWLDGAITKDVDNVVEKYEYGHFDGMNDIYEYDNHRDDIPQAKYITTSREMSHETRAALMPDAERIFEVWKGTNGCYNANTLLYRIFCQCSLPAGAVCTGIIETDVTAGMFEELYKITYR